MRLAPAVAAALGTVTTLSCSGLLGIDDEQDDVAKALCACPEALDFGDVACVDYITKRLKTATPSTRSSWMETFDKYCRNSCNGCWNAAFHTRPTCTDATDECALQSCQDCCVPTTQGAGQCAG